MSATEIRGSGQRPDVADVRSRLTHTAIMTLARWTPYLEEELLGLASVVKPGSVCVDAGAAAGLYTAALAQLTGPTGEVHSIEPLSIAHPTWRRVLRIAGRDNVRVHPVALGMAPGEGVMSVPKGRWIPVTGRSFLTTGSTGLGSNSEFSSSQEVTVTVDTIDALLERAGVTHVDFIKIDVEGGEWQVLRGAERTINEFKPAILAEIEARHTSRYDYAPADLVSWLRDRGYAMYTWQNGWEEAHDVCAHRRNYLFRPVTATAATA